VYAIFRRVCDSGEPALGRASSPLRVLLAEDNPPNRKLASLILKERGHKVDVAGDGEEAIRLATRKDYEIILMDAAPREQEICDQGAPAE